MESVLENQSNAAPEQKLDTSGPSKVEPTSRSPQVITEGDDSVFYSEEEEIPQQILDSIWTPHSGEPIWPEKPHPAPQIYISETQVARKGTELKEASSESDGVHGGTAANSREITHTEDPPLVPSKEVAPDEAEKMKEKADAYTDGSGEEGPPGGSGVSAEEEEQELGPFDHLTHAKYGTVSYRRIKRGQTRKKIEMFESMMQL